MSITGILCYLSIPIGLWAAFLVFWLTETQESFITNAAILSTAFSMITGPFWIIYVVYLAIRLIPKLDEIAIPGGPANREYPDSWLARGISLNSYAGDLMSARVRRKDKLAIDFRDQPFPIRLALKVHVYWMCLGALSMLTGFLLFEFAD
ncbi:hypothetical protein [Marinobacter sp. LN3S78]|uniref:hypothetical protein n=1 Tax=Marinobacter sp. LN3S78 TaxID=3382300 RepID=UPI00387AC43B